MLGSQQLGGLPKVGLRPRMLTGPASGKSPLNTTLGWVSEILRTDVADRTNSTTILGHEFSAPIFISPAAAPGAIGGYVPENEELGLLKRAYTGGIPYIPAM